MRALAIRTDGVSLYSASQNHDAIGIFDRDAATGALTFDSCLTADTGIACNQVAGATADGIDSGLDDLETIALSPDDRSLYGASEFDDAVSRFAREPAPAADTDPPETEITKKPKNKTGRRKAKFKFEADEAGATFECKLDKKAFKPCETPFKTKKLKPRKHKFRVRAVDAAGNRDETPAKDGWKIRKPK
jgi:hypothetical protein